MSLGHISTFRKCTMMEQSIDKLGSVKYLLIGALGNKSKDLFFNTVYGQTRNTLYISYFGDLDRKFLSNAYEALSRFMDENKNEFEMYFEDNLDNLESNERGFRIRIQDK